MNSLVVISEQGWQIAGWTMVYYLALGTLVALVAAVLRFMMRGVSPNLRYATSLAVFAMLALLPAGIAIWLAQTSSAKFPLAASPPAAVSPVIDLAREPVTPSPTVSQIPAVVSPQPVEATVAGTSVSLFAEQAIEYLPWLWLIGTPLTFMLLATGLVGAERLRRSSQPLANVAVTDALDHLRGTLNVGRKVTVAICDRVATPLLVGIVRPLILLPPAAVTGWSPEELEMVLLHELAHVRRWDNLVNLVQRIVESALFFHPAVWLVSHWVRVDREDCCDAVVVARTAKPQAYAELLVSLASASQPLAGLALARHPLSSRIRRILRLPEEPMRVSRGTLVAIGVAIVLLTVAPASRGVPAADAEESTAEDAESAEEIAKLRSLFDIRGQKLVTVRYHITEKYDGQTEDALEGLERDPYGPKIAIKRHWVRKGELLDITAPQRAHDEFIRPFLSKLNRLAASDDDEPASRGVPAPGAEEKIDPAVDKVAEPGKIPVQFFPQTTSPKVMEQAVRELKQAGHNVTVLPTDQGTVLLIDRDMQLPEQVRWPSMDSSGIEHAKEAMAKRLRQEAEQVRQQVEQEESIAHRFHKAQQAVAQAELEQAHKQLEQHQEKIAKLTQQIDMLRKHQNIQSQIVDLNHQVALKKQEGQAAADSELLQPGDVVVLQVKGALPEEPLWDKYRIESMGTIALGPTYGRVKIAGKGLLDAEAIIKDHLQEYLENPLVQLTLKEKAIRGFGPPSPSAPPAAIRNFTAPVLPREANGEWPIPAVKPEAPRAIEAPAAPPAAERPKGEPQVLYDGKTFEEWRELWKTELKTEHRIECIKALAAFGRAGRGQEAAEAILDVAEQVDFNAALAGGSPEDTLRNQILELLQKFSAFRMDNKALFESVLERAARNGKSFQPLADNFIRSLDTSDEGTRQKLLELAADSESPLRSSAILTLTRGDQELSQPETVELIHQSLVQDQPNMEILRILQYRHLDQVPEQFDLLFHSDPDVRFRAWRTLREAGRPAADVIDRLLSVLEDPAQEQKHREAIRAIGSTQEWIASGHKKRAASQLEEIVRAGDEELVVPALATLNVLFGQSTAMSIQEALEEGAVSNERRQLLQDGDSLDNQISDEANQVRMRGRGGYGGGGGGGFF